MNHLDGSLNCSDCHPFDSISDPQVRCLFLNAFDAMILLDPEGRLTAANPAARELLAIDPDRPIARRWEAFSPSEELATIAEKLAEHDALQGTGTVMGKNGGPRNVEYRATANFTPDRHLLILKDLTNCHQLETDFLDIRERHQLVIQGIGEGVWDWDCKTDVAIVSPRYWEIQGYDPDEMGNESFSDFLDRVHPDDRDRLKTVTQNHLERQEPYEIEMRVRHRDGHYIWIYSRAQAVRDETGRPRRMVGAVADISDRKQAELALQEREALFRKVTANIPGAIFRYILHPDGSNRVIYMSPSCHDVWEVEAERVARNSQCLWDMTHPDDLRGLYESVIRSAQTLKLWVHEWRVLPPSRRQKWLHGIGRPERQPDGSIIWDSFALDITARKQAEIALRDNEERLRLALFAANQGLYDLNIRTGEAIVSPEYARMLGYEPEELQETNLKWRDRLHPDDLPSAYQAYDDYIARRRSDYRVEFRQRTKTGEWQWILSVGKLVEWDRDGRPLRMIGTHTDIGAYKQMEADLRESRRQLQDVLNSCAAHIVQLWVFPDRTWEYKYIAPGCERLYGYTAEEIVADPKLWSSRVHPDDFQTAVRPALHALLDRGEDVRSEYRFYRKDGILRWFAETLTGRYDPGQNLWSVTVVAVDTTERKEAELALQQSEYLFRSVLETVPLIAAIVDRRGDITLVNDCLLEQTGWKREEILHRNWFSIFIPPEIRESLYEFFFRRAPETGEFPVRYENEILTRTGERRLIAWNNTALRDRDRRIVGFASIGEDITDRRRAEEALKRQAQQERLILEITHQVRQSLELEEILTFTVTTIRQTLDADRVEVFRFDADGNGTAIAQSHRNAATPLSEPSPDGSYTLDAPIMQSQTDGTAQVWGLLIVHAHPRAENWDLVTPSFLRRLADQLAIAIRQSELYREARTQLTKHQEIADRLQHDVLHDHLTGLPNRTALMKRLCQVCQPREPGDRFSKFAILFLDLNGFKKINDNWGHAAGDRVLKIVARRLQTCIRDTDLVARLGGDEFVLLLEPIREVTDVIEVGDRIHQVLQGAIELEETTVTIGTSIGIAIGESPAAVPEQLLDEADRAMYQAKRKRLRYVLFGDAGGSDFLANS